MIDTVLAVAIGLLAVSVLVSLVGVANTLSLSVAERTRENGLLRALGLTRRQMKAMLVLESLLISVSGTLAGVLLGIGFGWVGVHALPLDLERTIVVVPWWQVAGVGAIAIVCAVVAAWLPGRRAARTSPVEALAAE
jgi:putative ABC transport system permease protein